MNKGVPQGSSPKLVKHWLQASSLSSHPPRCTNYLLCRWYSHNCRGKKWTRTLRLTETAVAAITAKVQGLGLKVAAKKTETLWIGGLPRTRRLPITWLAVQSERIRVKNDLKYLGVTLDGRLKFDTYFDHLSPKVEGIATLLGRLLSNVGGPNCKVRRLYSGVMILYGSPIRYRHITNYGNSILRKIQRRMAIRMIRGYRTVSHEATITLAGISRSRRLTPLHITEFKISAPRVLTSLRE